MRSSIVSAALLALLIAPAAFAKRNVLLLLDQSFISAKGMERAQQAAREFVAQRLQPGDAVAVATIDADGGFAFVTSFTSDRALLRSAIDAPDGYRGDDPLRLAGSWEAEPRPPRAIAEGSRERIERQLETLGKLADALRVVRGRKEVVLFTEGFDARFLAQNPRDTRTQSFQNEAVARGLMPEGQIITPGGTSRMPTSHDESESKLQRNARTASATPFEAMATHFRAAGAVLDVVDLQRLRVNVQGGELLNTSQSLELLTHPTGGRVMQPDDLASLTAAPETDARAAPAIAAPRSAGERMLANADAVVNDIPHGAVPLRAWAAPYPAAGELATVPVILEIPGPALLQAAAGNVASAQIYLYAFNAGGAVVDRLYQKVAFDLNKVGGKLRSGGVKYYATLALPPGTYAVKSLVCAAETLQGFARLDIVVPRSGQPAIGSPLFIEEGPSSWLLVRGASHARGGPDPFEIAGRPILPTTRATGRFTVLVWNAAPDELTWQTRPAATFLGHVQSGSATKLLFQLDHLDPSVATLDVMVRKKGGTDTLKASVPLTSAPAEPR